jgi:hypothetical protein
LLDLADPGRVRWLLEPSLDEALHTPRFSPDGSRVVFSMAVPGGGRNLWILDLSGGEPRPLTRGEALDLDPVFSPDGKYVYFASDRTGIFNLYRLELATGNTARITNLATGAFSPEPLPDGSGLVFVVYGPSGFDLALLPAPHREHADDPRFREPRPATPDLSAASDRYPVEDYSPFSTLLPRSWLPLIGSDPDGATVGLLFGGSDALDFASYQVSLSLGLSGRRLAWDVSANLHLLYPYLFLFHSKRSFDAGNDAVLDGQGFAVTKTEYLAFAELAFPFSAVRSSHVWFINYDFHWFDRETPLSLRPDDASPILPDDRRRAWLGLGWSYSNLRYTIDSISAEKGVWSSVSLRYSHPQVGSGTTLVEGRLALRGYLPMWRENHVLALGLNAGAATGDDRRRPVYWIGGLPVRDPLQDAYFGYRYADVYLRGYDPWAFSGYAYALASAEYRLPLCDIERGVLTLPVYAGRLHAAAFVDVGAAALSLSELPSRLKVGLGAELRLDLMLAYYFPMTVRLGYARGLMAEGIHNVFLTLGNGF